MKAWVIATFVASATYGLAHAQPIKKEADPVDPTGLIIAGIALAAFAVLFLIGRKKKSEPASSKPELGDLAEVRLVIETDERATVWTTPTLKLQTDRLGEVVLHLPIGTHEATIQIGSETYTRTIEVPAIKRMHLPINLAKERISRAVSGEMPAIMAAAKPTPLLTELPRPQRVSTSPARALPDASSQAQLGAQLAGLIDIELDAPKPAEPTAPPLERGKIATTQPANQPLKLDFSAIAGDLSIGGHDMGASLPAQPPRQSPFVDVPARSKPQTGPLEGVRAIPGASRARQPSGPLVPQPAALDISLDEPRSKQASIPPLAPEAPPDELIQPRAAASGPTKTNHITDFELDDFGPSAPPPPLEMPQAAALDLAPSARAPAAPKSTRDKLPSVTDFELDIGDMPARPAPRPVELPKVDAASVADLSLDDGDGVPIQRIQTGRTTSRPVPALDEFTLDHDIPLDGPRAGGPLPKAMPMPRPAAPVEGGRAKSLTRPPGPASGVIGGRYRKLGPAGNGPSGALFRGRDESATRDVLIEELPPEVTLAGNAKTLVGLSHANIVRFLDHVSEGGIGYVITEVVEGKPLDQFLAERGGSLASLEAIGIVDQVCAALAYAHERGVFHRGLRPSCIVLAGRTVKVRGFGMTLGANTDFTAPELLVGGGAADARSDLYSIGVVLVQMLTGKLPDARLQLPGDVPRNLASVIRKLLSREPTIRPTSVKTVRDAFSAIF